MTSETSVDEPFLIPGQSVFTPLLDGHWILLTGNLWRLLWRESQVMENTADMVGVVRYVKLPADDFRYAAADPLVGAISGSQRTGRQERDQLLFMIHRKLGGRTGMGIGGKRLNAPVVPRPLPILHAEEVDADKSGDLWQRLPCLEILCSTTTAFA